jgi:nucleotide-binding universal stress UspA family protein
LAAHRVGVDGRVVIAHVAAVPVEFADTPYHEHSLEAARQRADVTLAETDDLLAGVPGDLRVLEGPPARALVELAREVDADEIAVGSRGFGQVRMALGSTSHALLHEADRPVLIVTRRAAERLARRAASPLGEDRSPTVVVGYDGSSTARAALEYAADRMRARGGRVVVVYAYHAAPGYLGTPYYQRALDESQQRGRQLLADVERDAELGSLVETDLVEGPPAEAVARAAVVREASEIVVGSRGLGRFRGAIGSVSHALLHEADCPVVVVPGAAQG